MFIDKKEIRDYDKRDIDCSFKIKLYYKKDLERNVFLKMFNIDLKYYKDCTILSKKDSLIKGFKISYNNNYYDVLKYISNLNILNLEDILLEYYTEKIIWLLNTVRGWRSQYIIIYKLKTMKRLLSINSNTYSNLFKKLYNHNLYGYGIEYKVKYDEDILKKHILKHVNKTYRFFLKQFTKQSSFKNKRIKSFDYLVNTHKLFFTNYSILYLKDEILLELKNSRTKLDGELEYFFSYLTSCKNKVIDIIVSKTKLSNELANIITNYM